MKRLVGALLAAACVGISGSAYAAPTIVIHSPSGALSDNYYYVDFYVDCGEFSGPNQVTWAVDGHVLGGSEFYIKFVTQHYNKAPSGKHKFTVTVTCGGDPTPYDASTTFSTP